MPQKVILTLWTFLFLMSSVVYPVSAFDPTRTNNKFGIHLAQPQSNDIDRAAELVNSGGGKWGYITLVIQENDRDVGKWQEVFNKLREKRLIPIIRLGTQPVGASWRKPNANDADDWVKFLNSLNWVVKDRYIILFNETNHGAEWGGFVDPDDFANVTKTFAQKLKAKNSDYFIMLGGFDASAPSQPPAYQDEALYLRRVIEVITPKDFNTLFDGLSSHSYPNPGFVGSPYGAGRGTVRTYQWELNLLDEMGVKELPVFITETGWNGNAVDRNQVAENFRIAFSNIWLPDDRVAAVTPFILNYQGEPFLQFSWIKPGEEEVYPEYDLVKGMYKRQGNPKLVEKGIISTKFPTEIVAESTYHFSFKVRNSGQSIWDAEDGYKIVLEGEDPSSYLVSHLTSIKPTQDRQLDIFLRTDAEEGSKSTAIVLYKNNEKILQSPHWEYEVVPLPPMEIQTSLFPKFIANGEDFEVQVFDEHEELVYKETGVKVEKGKGKVESVKNIALDEKYRVVLLKPNYLPVQTFVTFKSENNTVKFSRMFPFDANGDGALHFDDFWLFITNPGLFKLLLP